MSENSLGPWRPAPLALLSALLAVTACSDDGPDAYGNFEATEVVVSAEVGGTLVHFEARRGDRIPEGTVVGYLENHHWRKPSPGMIHDLMQHWPVRHAGSFVIGREQGASGSEKLAPLPLDRAAYAVDRPGARATAIKRTQ